MKKTLSAVVMMLVITLALVVTVSCESLKTTSISDTPLPSISSIRSFDDLMLYVKGYVKVTEDAELKELDEASRELVYPIIKNVFFSELEDLESDYIVSIYYCEVDSEKASGSIVWCEGAYNASVMVDGKMFKLKDYIIDGDTEPYTYGGGTALYGGEELSFEEAKVLLTDLYSADFSCTEIHNSVKDKAFITSFLNYFQYGDKFDYVDKIYYSEEVEGKTVSFSITPDHVESINERTLEYIAIDGVLYDTKEIVESLKSEVVK